MIKFKFADAAELLDFVSMFTGFIYDEYSSLNGKYGIIIEGLSVTVYDLDIYGHAKGDTYTPKHAKNDDKGDLKWFIKYTTQDNSRLLNE